MNMQVHGIHHVTAIAGDPQANVDFYAGVLGLRLVKVTVNYDDPHTYHLYYGDEEGHPGTILTFFPWPGAPRGRAGTGPGDRDRVCDPRRVARLLGGPFEGPQGRGRPGPAGASMRRSSPCGIPMGSSWNS